MKAKEITNEYFLTHVFDYQNNTDNWQFKGDRPAVIDFYATWCGPCKAMAPHLERIAEEYDGKIDVYKVDVDQDPNFRPFSTSAPCPRSSSSP